MNQSRFQGMSAKGCQVTIPLGLIGTPLEGAGIYFSLYINIYVHI